MCHTNERKKNERQRIRKKAEKSFCNCLKQILTEREKLSCEREH